MAEVDVDEARSLVASLILDPSLVRALATGRHRGTGREAPTRVELRYVDLAAGRRLQVVRYDGATALTSNHGDDAGTVVGELLQYPFANWHVDTASERVQLQLTRKGKALLTRKAGGPPIAAADHSHDRRKRRLLEPSDAVFRALGLTTDDGTVKPSRSAKFTQVQDFLATLAPVVADAVRLGPGTRTAQDGSAELRVADLGCGNAYLTFAAARFLSTELDIGLRVTGVDEKAQARRHNMETAEALGLSDTLTFVEGRIDDVVLEPPDVVLALHACDTATDDALARAIRWRAGVILAAPCCHRDVQRQLRVAQLSPAQQIITRSGILTERLADTLTDAFRAALLRLSGYRVDVVEFVEAAQTPRNTLLRAVRTDAAPRPEDREAYEALVAEWQVRPALQILLEEEKR